MPRILAIEDDETTAREIVSELTRHGFEVEWVADGRQGLARAVSGEFAAVTLDRMLPGVDGLAIVSVMRSAGIDIPVLMISALTEVDERVRGLRAGGEHRRVYQGQPEGDRSPDVRRTHSGRIPTRGWS